ncbi:MAG: non-ribosomal peptide synthetase module [Clostridiales bacterium]|nr:non-ribosomal peptide synthetase module [Clostridiales bacterium]HZJ76327.1 DUF6063 family protein [Oscillospiraceae bacterium]
MDYNNDQVMKAFKIYSKLAAEGLGEKEDLQQYLVDDRLRGLVDQFAEEVQCVIFVAGDFIYMIPKAMASDFHVSNETIKREHLPTRASNADIYLMYIATIVLFGEFYDSYQTTNPTRDFVSIEHWLDSVNERIFSLKEHDMDKLEIMEKEYEYNWITILGGWELLDDIKEGVIKQDARTASRLTFLNMTKNFLEEQGLINDIGNDEIELTEKAKIIIQRYYMDDEFNRGILNFMYGLEPEENMGV